MCSLCPVLADSFIVLLYPHMLCMILWLIQRPMIMNPCTSSENGDVDIDDPSSQKTDMTSFV